MKRAISMLLAIALACSFVFAGGAAASAADHGDELEQEIEQEAELNQNAEATVDQYQDVDQSNIALQGGNVAVGGTAYNTADQTNQNVQYGEAEAENEGEINQEAENEVEFEFGF